MDDKIEVRSYEVLLSVTCHGFCSRGFIVRSMACRFSSVVHFPSLCPALSSFTMVNTRSARAKLPQTAYGLRSRSEPAPVPSPSPPVNTTRSGLTFKIDFRVIGKKKLSHPWQDTPKRNRKERRSEEALQRREEKEKAQKRKREVERREKAPICALACILQLIVAYLYVLRPENCKWLDQVLICEARW